LTIWTCSDKKKTYLQLKAQALIMMSAYV